MSTILKIKLSPPHLVSRKYVVFIDREVRQSFSSKRKACDYINKIENELNEALLFINEYFCTLTTFYRNYFLADRDYRFKYEVEACFHLIDNRLNYIATHTGSENFNPIISQALNICFDSLAEACGLIDTKARARYDMLTRRRIELHNKIIIQYKGSFENFKMQSIYLDKLKSRTA
jgi:hypothetical protein